MRFGETPIDEAAGAILAHSWRANGVNFAKGRRLSADDVAKLKAGGVAAVVAARLDPEDIHEDEAAAGVAKALAGEGIEVTAPFTGRCNHFAREAGLAVIDHERIDELNELDESVTVATLPPYARVEPRQMVATVKIIPYAAPRTAVARAVGVAKSANQPLVSVAPFQAMRAGLVQTRLPGTRDKVLDKAVGTTSKRLTSLGSMLAGERRVAHDAKAIAGALAELKAEGCDLFLIAGASAIVDRQDVVPSGIEAAGGKVTHFGMPVDPGNLLLTGELDGLPVLGLPGCAKSPKYNGFDMVLERLAARLPVGRAEIVRMGSGGLLAEIASRPQPRDDSETEGEGPQQAPRVAALVLAAGRSTRMGGPNKLLADAAGAPLVVHAVKAALASQAVEVVVVLGHMEDQVKPAIEKAVPAKSRLRFVTNPDFAEGLSTSVKTGIAALGANIDAAVVQLGDMPGVGAPLLDRLIAAFSPVEGRSICVPTVGGKRGNPVLWARRFFPEMTALSGDSGAKHLIGEHADLVCEVEMTGEAAITDIDTPEALEAWRARSTA
ncbi:MAG: molybdopterin-binding/glycosyltransferase family 2 protein [Reyranella sp.]|uniref:molybdopterin-binding/glycosyltransferase family 2 protein n=1 Tax=Reyranella sp. TaxID=1929291 RepID=UPI001AD26E38|nr:molybdopterin-binding/glycosyltransferase family 2 protein [Reyranella sp.]MBN9539695.1 molybdopterin-binding/glycosyltransferase family 2 protein [Alphaproteobacteria bacterium]MBR2814606.1 molybdopterin-binding/glycosyltransferase family 2 protein [Reyranella sp.]